MSGRYRADLAAVHDAGFAQGAEAAARTLLRELDAVGHRSGLVVDLGCGAGQLVARACASGYQALGVDLSPAMIELARRRAPSARFEIASFLDAELPPCVAVTLIGEVVNYVDGDEAADVRRPALRRLWKRIHAALEPRGVLLLDLLGPGAVPGERRRSYRVEDDWAVLVEVREDGRRLTRSMTTFRLRDDHWRRDDEVHEQLLIEPGTVATELRRAGFRVRGRRAWGEGEPRPGRRALVARRA